MGWKLATRSLILDSYLEESGTDVPDLFIDPHYPVILYDSYFSGIPLSSHPLLML